MSSEVNNEIRDWQEEAFTFEQQNEKILRDGLYCDVEFVVKASEKPQIFKAHKLRLAQTSAVFETMFYGSVPQQTPVEIDDIEPNIFEDFLKFIYLNRIREDLTIPEAWDLYKAAHKYRVVPLLVKLRNKIKEGIRSDKTYCILSFENAQYFDDEEIKCCMLKQIIDQINVIVQKESFLDAKVSTLLFIVQQPKLQINELDLFKAIDKYHMHCMENNTRSEEYDEVMRKIIKEIRFLTFTLNQFITVCSNSSLLTDSEKLIIINIINSCNIQPNNKRQKHTCEYCLRTTTIISPVKSSVPKDKINDENMPADFSKLTTQRI